MHPFCAICKRSFATSFNLNRHLETYHSETAEKGDDLEEISDSKSENASETNDTDQASDTDQVSDTDEGSDTDEASDSDEASENSHGSEDRDEYTYDEVRAIVRFALKWNDR